MVVEFSTTDVAASRGSFIVTVCDCPKMTQDCLIEGVPPPHTIGVFSSNPPTE